MPKLSIIIPVYNEVKTVERIHQEIAAVLDGPELKGYEAEILFTDNHSTDQTDALLQKMIKADPRVRTIRLSRNFGFQANILTGYQHARGDAVIQIDADGEDDPRLIIEFVRLWQQGYKVVYGVRRSRHEGWLMSIQRRVFYRFLRTISTIAIPLDAGDFRLVDRQVVEVLKQFREANPYLRGILAYSGFSQVGVPYDRRPRFAGESKFSWWDYVSLALDGVTSFSRKPLAIATWTGFALATVSFLGAIAYLIKYFLLGAQAAGFTTLIIALLFVSGIQLICLGLLGAYVGRIFDEVKRRPVNVIESSTPPL